MLRSRAYRAYRLSIRVSSVSARWAAAWPRASCRRGLPASPSGIARAERAAALRELGRDGRGVAARRRGRRRRRHQHGGRRRRRRARCGWATRRAGGDPAQGALLIESSTISPAWIDELAATARRARLHAPRRAGHRQPDAGGQRRAAVSRRRRRRTRSSACARSSPRWAAGFVHLGPTGSGARMKLINNFVCGVQAASLAEGDRAHRAQRARIATRADACCRTARPAVRSSTPSRTRMATRDYTVNFTLALMRQGSVATPSPRRSATA